MTANQVKYMAERFLQWKLPPDFAPDNGISFAPEYPTFGADQVGSWAKREPVGTNLLTATQAEAMVRFMLEGAPAPEAKPDP